MKKILFILCFLVSAIAIASPKHDGSDLTGKGSTEICEEAAEEVQKDYIEEIENKGLI